MSQAAFLEVADTVENTPTEPSPDGSNGRLADGRFAIGSLGGCGNPFTRRVAALRSALLEAVSPDDLCGIVRKMVELAKVGHVAAAKIVLEYTLGKPAKAVEPDQLDIEEWQNFKATAPMMKESVKLSTNYNSEWPVMLVRASRNAGTHTQKANIDKGLTGYEAPAYLRELREKRMNRF